MNEVEDALDRVKQFHHQEYRKNVHVVWEKTVGDQKMVATAIYNPDTNADSPYPWVLVYENSELKHFFVQAPTPAVGGRPELAVILENFKKPEKYTSAEFYTPELQFYHYIVKTFIDSSYLYSSPSDKGAVRWGEYPYPRVPVKYVIPSIIDDIMRAVKCARQLNSKPMGELTDEFCKKIMEYMQKKYKFCSENITEEAKEVLALIEAAAVRRRRLLIMRGNEVDVEKQKEADLKAAVVWTSALLDAYAHTDTKDIVVGGLKEDE